MGDCMNTEGAKQAVMIEFELKLINWEKIWIHLRSNSEKERIPCVTDIVLALYVFMSSNRCNAPFDGHESKPAIFIFGNIIMIS